MKKGRGQKQAGYLFRPPIDWSLDPALASGLVGKQIGYRQLDSI